VVPAVDIDVDPRPTVVTVGPKAVAITVGIDIDVGVALLLSARTGFARPHLVTSPGLPARFRLAIRFRLCVAATFLLPAAGRGATAIATAGVGTLSSAALAAASAALAAPTAFIVTHLDLLHQGAIGAGSRKQCRRLRRAYAEGEYGRRGA